MMDSILVALHNSIVTAHDEKTLMYARYCLYSYMYEHRVPISSEIYYMLLSDKVVDDSVYHFEDLEHMANESLITDFEYHANCVFFYYSYILTCEYLMLLTSIKKLYNSDVELSIRIGRLNKIEIGIQNLAKTVLKFEVCRDVLLDLGVTCEFDLYDEINEFSKIKSYKDIDFVGIDKKQFMMV